MPLARSPRFLSGGRPPCFLQLCCKHTTSAKLTQPRPLGHPDFSTGSPNVFHWVTQRFPWATQSSFQQRVTASSAWLWLGASSYWLEAICYVFKEQAHFSPWGLSGTIPYVRLRNNSENALDRECDPAIHSRTLPRLVWHRHSCMGACQRMP